MKAFLQRFDIFLQTARVDFLRMELATERAEVDHHMAQLKKTSDELLAANLHLAQMQGELPQPVRNVIPTQSKMTSILFGRQNGFSARHPGLMFAGIGVCLMIVWTL